MKGFRTYWLNKTSSVSVVSLVRIDNALPLKYVFKDSQNILNFSNVGFFGLAHYAYDLRDFKH
jgi:hypothetical protein